MGRMTSHILWKNKKCSEPPTRLCLLSSERCFFSANSNHLRQSSRPLVLLLTPSDDDPGAGHLCLVQIDQRPKDLLHDDGLGVPILFFLED